MYIQRREQQVEFNDLLIRNRDNSETPLEVQDAAGTSKFKVTNAGVVTLASTITVDGASTLTGAVTIAGITTPTGGLAAAGGFSVSPRLVHSGGTPATAAADGTNSTPSVTETYIGEIFIPCNMTVTGIAVFNGTVVTGNMFLGLADSTGANVAVTASTAGSGTDAYQLVPFTSTYAALGPATYFITIQYNNTAARFNTHTVGTFGAAKKTGDTFGTFTTVTPPTTFTTALANIASLY